jgi:hypothetical protein
MRPRAASVQHNPAQTQAQPLNLPLPAIGPFATSELVAPQHRVIASAMRLFSTWEIGFRSVTWAST